MHHWQEIMPQLKITLPLGWRPVSTPNGPTTYVRGNDPDPPTLQFSIAEYKRGNLTNLSVETLMGICDKLASRVTGKELISRSSGNCKFGIFAEIAVKGEYPRHFQGWVLNNGNIFILVTYICAANIPSPEDMEEANLAALNTVRD
jgi:hypothetical protein